MNRLKSYVRRTILASAREYSYPSKRRTAEGTESAFRDAMRGTDTGWWSDLIYTAPMLEMAHRYRRDIATALEEYRDATGEAYVWRDPNHGQDVDASRILSSLMTNRPWTFAEYQQPTTAGYAAEASLHGLRFAVEWYAGELARDFAPNL